MNTQTARQIELSHLTDERLSGLHAFERQCQGVLTPFEINRIGRLPEHGESDVREWGPWETEINKIEYKTTGEMVQGFKKLTEELEPWRAALLVQHEVDKRVRSQVRIIADKPLGVRDRIRGLAGAA